MTNQEAVEYLYKLFVKAEITDEYGDMDDTEPYETAIDMAIEALQEQKTGKWIGGKWIGDKCSVCGVERAWYGCSPKYCPDCGCDMRGENDG